MLSKSSKAKPAEKNMQLYQKGIWLYKSQNNQELKKKKAKTIPKQQRQQQIKKRCNVEKQVMQTLN